MAGAILEEVVSVPRADLASDSERIAGSRQSGHRAAGTGVIRVPTLAEKRSALL